MTLKPEWGECKAGGVFLWVPTNEKFQQELTGSIPNTKCRWDLDRGEWWIHDNHIHIAEELLKKHFPEYNG